ncbi:MAG: hypothetical protein ACLQJ7_04430 [Syntrophobacteraceae bacterium]
MRDLERDRIARLVIHDIGRLAATPGDLEGALFELQMRKVRILCVEGEGPAEWKHRRQRVGGAVP